MPRFFFSFLALFFIALAVWARTLTQTSPESLINLAVFFASFLITIFSFSSLAAYLIFFSRIIDTAEQRSRFRKSLRLSLFFSLLITVGAVLKAVGAFNPLNLGLLLVLSAILWFYYLR